MSERNGGVKLCECGCGNTTPFASRTNRRKGIVKGQPTRFLAGHGRGSTRRGTKHRKKYTCIGLDGHSCTTEVAKPDVRCAKCSHKHYLTTNRERDRQRNAERTAAHYRANRDEYKQRSRSWKLENPERALRNSRRSTDNRRDKLRIATARWVREHPEAVRAICSRRRMRVKVAMSAMDRALSRAYRLAIAGDPCFYCGGPGEEDDHYQALAAGGTDHWWNLVRACRSCNARKNAMHGDEFRKLMMRRGPQRPVGPG
jgi:5-methylcytosine-specific restriction endonuclease McrA